MLEQQTWVSLLGVAAAWLALMGYLRNMRQDLKADTVGLRTELKADLGSLRSDLKADLGSLRSEFKADLSDLRVVLKADIADLKTDIGRLDSRLTTLENRTYDISTRLPPAPASASPPKRT